MRMNCMVEATSRVWLLIILRPPGRQVTGKNWNESLKTFLKELKFFGQGTREIPAVLS